VVFEPPVALVPPVAVAPPVVFEPPVALVPPVAPPPPAPTAAWLTLPSASVSRELPQESVRPAKVAKAKALRRIIHPKWQ
jgi:hypothetical protein